MVKDKEPKKEDKGTKETTPPEPEPPVSPPEPPQSSKLVDDAVNAAAEVEKQVEALKQENDRKEVLMAKEALGGVAEGGIVAEPPKKLTDTEYAEALERGEVDPLKEDGFINRKRT